MLRSDNHIISSIQWSTTLDEKNSARILQNRLSDWTRRKMPSQADSVLKSLSSPFYSWKIDSLTLDLGQIRLDKLESDLNEIFSDALFEQLRLLLEKDTAYDQKIFVVDNKISTLNILKYFFLNGTMPWNYNSSFNSINELIAIQLNSNRKQFLKLIKHIGKSEIVQDRISRQLNSENQDRIIKLIEPYHYSFILDLRDSIYSLQSQLKLIPVSQSAYFDYINTLLLDFLIGSQNSAFNRQRFASYLIENIANKYDLNSEIIALHIQDVKQFEEVNYYINSSQKNAGPSSQSKARQSYSEDDWTLFSQLLNNAKPIIKSYTPDQFQELVTGLSKQNPVRFKNEFFEFKGSIYELRSALASFNDNELFIIIESLEGTKVSDTIEIIDKVISILALSQITLDRREIYLSALDYLITKRNTASDNSKLINHLISIIYKKQNKVQFINLIDHLLLYADRKSSTEYLIFDELLKSEYSNFVLDNSSLIITDLETILNMHEYCQQYYSSSHRHTDLAIKLFKQKVSADPESVNRFLANKEKNNTLYKLLHQTEIIIPGTTHFDESPEENIQDQEQEQFNVKKIQLPNITPTSQGIRPKLTEIESSELLQLIVFAITSKKEAASDFKSWILAFKRNVYFEPLEVARVMVNYFDKKSLQASLPAIFDDFHSSYLLRNAFASQYNIVEKINSNIDQIIKDANSTTKGMLRLLKHNLMTAGLGIIIQNENASDNQFYEDLIKYIFRFIKTNSLEALLSKEQNTILFNDTKHIASFDDLNITYAKLLKFNHESLSSIIAEKKIDRQMLGLQILAIINGDHFIKPKYLNAGLGKHVLEHLYRGQNLDKTQIIKSCLNEIKSLGSIEKIKLDEAEVNSLFWKCVVDNTQLNKLPRELEYQLKLALVNCLTLTQSPQNNNVQYDLHQFASIPILTDGEIISITQTDIFDSIQTGLEKCQGVVKLNGTSLLLSNLFVSGLLESPFRMRKIIRDIKWTKKKISHLATMMELPEFISFISCDLYNDFCSELKSYQILYLIIETFDSPAPLDPFKKKIWLEVLHSLVDRKVAKTRLVSITKETFDQLSTACNISLDLIVAKLNRMGMAIPPIFKSILVRLHTDFLKPDIELNEKKIENNLDQAYRTGVLESVFIYMLKNDQVPSWFVHENKLGSDKLIEQIIINYPLILHKIIRHQLMTETRINNFCINSNFEIIIKVLVKLNPRNQTQIRHLGSFYKTLSRIQIEGVASRYLQMTFFKVSLNEWVENNVEAFLPDKMLEDFVWKVSSSFNIPRKVLLETLSENKLIFDPAYQLALEYLLSRDSHAKNLSQLEPEERNIAYPQPKQLQVMNNTELIAINNAGLVLLSDYISLLFDRVGFLENGKFKEGQERMDAVHYLQYLVTGLVETEEYELPLNKILCGLSPSVPVFDKATISEENKSMMNGLIDAVITHWPAIGSSSVDGFRGNWLVRNGALNMSEEKWELRVESRPYDLLINQSPFSFSIIKYPWMDKPLHVNWSY